MATTSSNNSNGMAAVLRVAASVVVAVLLVAACSDGSGEGVAANDAQSGGGGWDMLPIAADEVEYFDSLAQMGKMADIVVIAQPTGVDGTRRVGPEGDEGIDLAQVRFEVIRPISDWDKDSIVLEFPVASPEAYKALEEQVAGFPPAVLAVRDLGTVEPDRAGLYRLMNSESLWTEQPDGSGLVAPLAEEHQGPDESEAVRVLRACPGCRGSRGCRCSRRGSGGSRASRGLRGGSRRPRRRRSGVRGGAGRDQEPGGARRPPRGGPSRLRGRMRPVAGTLEPLSDG